MFVETKIRKVVGAGVRGDLGGEKEWREEQGRFMRPVRNEDLIHTCLSIGTLLFLYCIRKNIILIYDITFILSLAKLE